MLSQPVPTTAEKGMIGQGNAVQSARHNEDTVGEGNKETR